MSFQQTKRSLLRWKSLQTKRKAVTSLKKETLHPTRHSPIKKKLLGNFLDKKKDCVQISVTSIFLNTIRQGKIKVGT
jgi:hypothetical protein